MQVTFGSRCKVDQRVHLRLDVLEVALCKRDLPVEVKVGKLGLEIKILIRKREGFVFPSKLVFDETGKLCDRLFALAELFDKCRIDDIFAFAANEYRIGKLGKSLEILRDLFAVFAVGACEVIGRYLVKA